MDIVFAIDTGDNDFYYTYNSLCHAILMNKKDFMTSDKERLLRLLNELVYPFYRLSQNPYEYNKELDTEEGNSKIKNYLQISPKSFFFGREEVSRMLSKSKFSNGEIVVVDTSLNNPVYWV